MQCSWWNFSSVSFLIDSLLLSLVSSLIYLLMTLRTQQQGKVTLLIYFPNDVVSTGDIKKCLHGKPIYFEILQVPTVLLGNCRRHNGHLITLTNSLLLAKCSPSAAVTSARETSLRKLTANGRCMKRDNWMPRGLLPLHCDGVRTVVTGVRPFDWFGQRTI